MRRQMQERRKLLASREASERENPGRSARSRYRDLAAFLSKEAQTWVCFGKFTTSSGDFLNFITTLLALQYPPAEL